MADLLLHNGIVITMDPQRRVLENTSVAISDNRIVEIGPAARKLPSANLMGYSNAQVDDLLSRADRELDADQRAKLCQAAQAIMVDDLPALWLWEKFNPIAVRDGLVGLPSGAMHSEGVGWIK